MNFGQRYWSNSEGLTTSDTITLWDKTETDEIGSIPPGVSIVQFGIQTQPGVKLKINNTGTVTIGKTGIFEVDISNTNGEITKIEYTNQGEIATYIILDAVYKGGNK